MRAILVERYGGPEVLELVDVPTPEPADGQVLYEVDLAGINFSDTHRSENSYVKPQRLPYIPGLEFVGRDPSGRRVCGWVADGAYAEQVAAWPSAVWPVPDGLTDAEAIAIALQGTSAWLLLRSAGRLAKGESVLVQAAAGGVGSFLVQLAKCWGASRVIALASTEDKRSLALELGADVAVDPATDELSLALLEANGGTPIDLVLDMAGGRVFDQSFAAVAPEGRIVTYGGASRTPATPIQPESLMNGPRSVIGFLMGDSPPVSAYGRLAAMVETGAVKPLIGQSYPLAEARRAHEDILARRTVGVQTLDVRT